MEKGGDIFLFVALGVAALMGAVVLSEGSMDEAVGGVPESGASDNHGRSPQEVREDGNRLKQEQSLYLRQHANNPVDWSPWNDEALARARREDKPVFLSIGYSSCHWCHVMEEDVFEKDDVASVLNRDFVPIKVDREERPDLDAVYMEATQALTGGGGWPMSVFLTPELKPFFAGTYFPHDQFLSLLAQVSSAWENRRDAIEEQARKVASAVSNLDGVEGGIPGPTASSSEEIPGWGVIGEVVGRAVANRDPEWGGMMARMKFPSVPIWSFLLRHYRKTGDAGTGEAVRSTLEHMGSGGIHDQVGGGFHRYAVDREWLVPHFEKMLYDNAQLARIYLEASVVFDEPDFLRIARDTLDFMLDEMRGTHGGFFASFDADSGGEEGSYYVWTVDEIETIAGEADGAALARLLGAGKPGNFEGANVLTRRVPASEVAARLDRDEQAVAGLLDRWRPALKEHRFRRVAPALDRKVITAWNGLAVAAFADGYGLTGERRYLEAAEGTADYLWREHRRTGGALFRASYESEAYGEGILDDYAFLADGLLALFRAGGDRKVLERALLLIEEARKRFSAPSGGFYLTPEGHEAPMGRKIDRFDNAEPSGNGVLVNVLMEASALTGDDRLRQDAIKALGAHGELMGRAGTEMARWFEAAMKIQGPFYDVVIAGDIEDVRTRELRTVFRRAHPAHAVLVMVPSTGGDEDTVSLIPSVRGKKALKGLPTAFVCRFGQCKAPTSDPGVLAKQLMEGWTN